MQIVPFSIPETSRTIAGIREVDDKRAERDGGPRAQAKDQESADSEACRRPHGAGVLVGEGEQEAEPPRRDVHGGEQDERHAARKAGFSQGGRS